MLQLLPTIAPRTVNLFVPKTVTRDLLLDILSTFVFDIKLLLYVLFFVILFLTSVSRLNIDRIVQVEYFSSTDSKKN